MNLAVIDLGSNTFHLLIVEIDDTKNIKEKFRQRFFTSLCDGGIDVIKESSISYGLEICQRFKESIDLHQVSKFIITGTAALRTAKNSKDFILPAEKIFDQSICIIDGQEEAELIFDGIHLLYPMEEPTLIMDIGGGSTEFIIAEKGKIIWKNSYKLGVGVMYSSFHLTEPISKKDEENLRMHIRAMLTDLCDITMHSKVHTLIGASGSFEVLESMSGLITSYNTCNNISTSHSEKIIQKIIRADYEERKQMKGLPQERVKYIVVAMILIDEILTLINPKQIIVSSYALKEGLLNKLLNSLNQQ
jgi:exopolyphosphatase/guanosine-5'-triphosphate,3'-diphosphate pyrophosphatase